MLTVGHTQKPVRTHTNASFTTILCFHFVFLFIALSGGLRAKNCLALCFISAAQGPIVSLTIDIDWDLGGTVIGG